jgi:hypothetical protein
LPDDGAGNERPIPAEDNADAGEALSIDLPPLPMLPTSPARREKTAAAKWDQMRAGMTTSEVENLLGAPTNRSVDLYLTYWYYGTGRDAGRVAFITSSQRTMAWDPPLR